MIPVEPVRNPDFDGKAHVNLVELTSKIWEILRDLNGILFGYGEIPSGELT